MRTRAQVQKSPPSDRPGGGSSISAGKIVEVNHDESRPLVDIDESSSFWFGEAFAWDEQVRGAIVRICPPANWTDAEVASAEQSLREYGAVSVKVVRRQIAVMGAAGKVEMVEPMQDTISHSNIVEAKLTGLKEYRNEITAIVHRALDEGQKSAKPTVKPRGESALHIRAIRLFNWQRFQGQHAIEVKPQVYAITAEHEEYEGRSNWLGKSSLLGSIPFALYGWHTRPKEDAWISDGENEGGIAVILSDGSVVQRSRTRGKVTQLALIDPNGVKCHGDEAQREIYERVGLPESDFFSTSFFVQKSIGQFVTMQPAKRQELISKWLNLGALRGAEDWARDMLDQAAGQESKAREQLVQWEQEAKRIEESFGNPGVPMQVEATIEQWFAEAGAQLKEAQEAAAMVRAQNQSAEHAIARRKAIEQAQIARARAAAELGTAEEAAKEIDRLALNSALDQAKEQYRKVSDEYSLALKEANARRSLLVSGFDGQCPVAQIECPAKDAINARKDEADARYRTAKQSLDESGVRVKAMSSAVTECERAIASANIKSNAFREAVRAYDAAMKAEQALGDMPPEIPLLGSAEEHDAKVQQYARDVERARAALVQYQNARKRIDELKGTAEQAAFETRLYGAAARLLGRGDGGVQKEIAAGALAVIEANTNRSLSESGIELSVSLKWGQESSTELAPHCNACGASFPNSKRVKVCARCGAERGPKVDEKVDFALSDRSGAAEDLAGFHLQIAAAAWLYGQRGVPWRVIAVDEPFGALDEAHRKAMGVHVAALLRSRYAFEQAFVIAHDVGSTDAMPGRIRVIAGTDGWSRVEVES